MNPPCEITGRTPSDKAHIRSKGSGGGLEDWNIIYMIRSLHQEQHRIGWFRFCEKHPEVKKILESKGWYFINEFGVVKLRRNEAIGTGDRADDTNVP